MFGKAKSISLVLLVMGCSSPLAALAKPTAPVSIEYSVPKTVQKGDVVSTLIRFVAQADLERLEVSVAPYEGLILASNEEKARFWTSKGEKHENLESKFNLQILK